VNPNGRNRYEFALETARQAGQLALRYFDQTLTVEWKKDQSPVTVADRETEALLRGRLLDRFPEDGFLGEESGDRAGSSGFRWIIDPIDATRNFVRAIPIWGTLVGLEYQGEMIAGVVEAPALQLSYHALRGAGAFQGDRRLAVSTVDNLSEATLFHTSLTWFKIAGRGPRFLDLIGRVQTERGYGDFYGYMLVAQGSGELMIEHGAHPWDLAAVTAIVEEAGGRVTDWHGNRTISSTGFVASNGTRLHEEALHILNG
jgi:histidinol-phosphatase